jgi:hypothetical protein
MDVVFLKNFVHGRIQGRAGKTGSVPDNEAPALAKAGLLRIVVSAPVVKKTAAAGEELLSSALPAAQALPLPTSSTSAAGDKPKRKRKSRAKAPAALS